MSAGLGITRGAKIVGDAIAAQTELLELRSIAVPLEDHGLGPVMPNGSCDHQVLAQEDIGRLAAHQRGSIAHINSRQSSLAVTVDAPVSVGEIEVAHVVKRLVNRQPSWPGVVPAKKAAGRGEKGLRQLRAGAAVIHKRRKKSCPQTAWKSTVVACVHQTGSG